LNPVSIKKPGKDASDSSYYRQIALTSHISKLIELVVNERLMYYVKKQQLIVGCQSGFRKGRRTVTFTYISCLEGNVRKVQLNKETVAAVVFDVEKAHDKLWKDRLLIKIHLMGIRGKLFNWVKDF